MTTITEDARTLKGRLEESAGLYTAVAGLAEEAGSTVRCV